MTVGRVQRIGAPLMAALLVFVVFSASVFAQTPATGAAKPMDEEKFQKQSLALRTALHYDPSLEAPLKQLLELYGKGGRVEELLSLYRSHITQFDQDAGAYAVFIRMLMALKKPEATQMVQAGVERFKENAIILFLRYQDLENQRDPRSLDFLSQAIEKETKPGRKRTWIDKLVEQAVAEDRDELATKHLSELANAPENTAETLVALARKMQKSRFHKLAIETLQKAEGMSPSPELNVDIALVMATSLTAEKKEDEAAAKLDALLKKVSPDYWRRPEIVMRRVNLLKTDSARETMLKGAETKYAAAPKSEAAALDYAELLIASELRRDALEMLLKASKDIPRSERIEKQILQLFDRLNDERSAQEYLKARTAEFPDRLDLEYRYVKAMYAVGDKDEAKKRFEALVEKLDEADRANQMLDLARYLRRMTQPGDAAKLFEKVITMLPERIDVRRELAESYIAIGDRLAAKKLFQDALTGEAEIENFLDVAQFMVQEELLVESRRALEERLSKESSNFDVRLLLLEVYGKLGDESKGREILGTTREIADTDVRYRNWLESGADFHELFDTVEEYFDAEQNELAPPEEVEWKPSRIQRFLIFCDVAGRSDSHSRVVDVLRERVADPNIPEKVRPQLRRLLVEALERDPLHAHDVQAQLELLVQEDAGNASEYRLRMAKIYEQTRPDLAQQYIRDIDLSKINDPALLSGVHRLCLNQQMKEMAVTVLDRLTTLEPSNRSNWEDYLGLLAITGDEGRFRFAVRRLLAGIAKMQLTDDTHALLRSHLVDSYWRSVARLLDATDQESLAEVLPHLEAIERSKQLKEDRLWVVWTRGYVLRKLGRDRAVEESVGLLESLVATATQPAPKTAENPEPEVPVEEPRIFFPDGLSLGVKRAVAMLTDPPAPSASRNTAANGPLPELEMRWGFSTDQGDEISQIEPLADGSVLLLDVAGTLYRIDGTNGKLIWRQKSTTKEAAKKAAKPAVVSSRYRGRRSSSSSGQAGFRAPPRVAIDEKSGRIFVPAGGSVVCRGLKDGERIWQSEVGGEVPVRVNRNTGGIAHQPPVELFADGNGRVLAYRSSAATVSAFHGDHGKLLWSTDLAGKDFMTRVVQGLTAGASFSDGYLLVFGHVPAVIDAASGEIVWSFERGKVREFPVKLVTPDDLDMSFPSQFGMSTGASSFGRGSSSRQRPASFNHLQRGTNQMYVNATTLTQKSALVAPGVAWAESSVGNSNISGVLHRKKMLLMGSQVFALSLELPLSATQFNVYGTFIGATGNKACFLSGLQISILNLTKQTTSRCNLSELGSMSTSDPNQYIDVSLAGSRIYAMGKNGVLCFNIHTGRKIFFAKWPGELTDWAGIQTDDAEKIDTDAAQPAIVRSGAYRNPYSGQGPGQYATTNYWRGLVRYNNYSRRGWVLPMRSRAREGVLYALVTPHRFAALVSDSTLDGEKDGTGN